MWELLPGYFTVSMRHGQSHHREGSGNSFVLGPELDAGNERISRTKSLLSGSS